MPVKASPKNLRFISIIDEKRLFSQIAAFFQAASWQRQQILKERINLQKVLFSLFRRSLNCWRTYSWTQKKDRRFRKVYWQNLSNVRNIVVDSIFDRFCSYTIHHTVPLWQGAEQRPKPLIQLLSELNQILTTVAVLFFCTNEGFLD